MTTGMAYRTFDWKRAIAQVDGVLASYPLPEAVASGSDIPSAA